MPDDRFAPPPEDKGPVELETEWGREKAAKQAATARAHAPRRVWKLGLTLAIVVGVAGLVTAGVIVQRHSKPADGTATASRTEGTIGIQIRSNPAAQIRIDGNKAGKTPLTVHMRKGTQQVRIEALINGKTQTKLIVPDQDQDVGFTR